MLLLVCLLLPAVLVLSIVGVACLFRATRTLVRLSTIGRDNELCVACAFPLNLPRPSNDAPKSCTECGKEQLCSSHAESLRRRCIVRLLAGCLLVTAAIYVAVRPTVAIRVLPVASLSQLFPFIASFDTPARDVAWARLRNAVENEETKRALLRWSLRTLVNDHASEWENNRSKELVWLVEAGDIETLSEDDLAKLSLVCCSSWFKLTVRTTQAGGAWQLRLVESWPPQHLVMFRDIACDSSHPSRIRQNAMEAVLLRALSITRSGIRMDRFVELLGDSDQDIQRRAWESFATAEASRDAWMPWLCAFWARHDGDSATIQEMRDLVRMCHRIRPIDLDSIECDNDPDVSAGASLFRRSM